MPQFIDIRNKFGKIPCRSDSMAERAGFDAYLSKHFAYCSPEVGLQMHRQRGFRTPGIHVSKPPAAAKIDKVKWLSPDHRFVIAVSSLPD